MPTTADEPYYCSQQIQIPPELPDIMKQFTKAAIRTQPKDVLLWAAAYFRALVNGEQPPVKDRLEGPTATQKVDSGLTPGILRILHKQLGPKKVVPIELIEEKWHDLALPKEQLDGYVTLGAFSGNVEWLKFFAIVAASLGLDISDSMRVICQILTADPVGGPDRISFVLFKELYCYLAEVDGDISEESIKAVLNFLEYEAEKQDGMVQPRNFLSPECPKLS